MLLSTPGKAGQLQTTQHSIGHQESWNLVRSLPRYFSVRISGSVLLGSCVYLWECPPLRWKTPDITIIHFKWGNVSTNQLNSQRWRGENHFLFIAFLMLLWWICLGLKLCDYVTPHYFDSEWCWTYLPWLQEHCPGFTVIGSHCEQSHSLYVVPWSKAVETWCSAAWGEVHDSF